MDGVKCVSPVSCGRLCPQSILGHLVLDMDVKECEQVSSEVSSHSDTPVVKMNQQELTDMAQSLNGDFGDFDDLSDLGDFDDVGDFGDFDDVGDFDDFDDLGDFQDFDDLGDVDVGDFGDF